MLFLRSHIIRYLNIISLTTLIYYKINLQLFTSRFSFTIFGISPLPLNSVTISLDKNFELLALTYNIDTEKATPFSKSKAEQTTTLSCGNKNLLEVVRVMITDYDPKKRYKITGEYDAENKVMCFDLSTAEVSTYRSLKEAAE